jgi:uncharacterized membrane protein
MNLPVRIRTFWEDLTSTLWFVPAAMTGAATALAFAMAGLDRRTGDGHEGWFFVYSGGADGAREVLSTVAGSMITVAGVVFSATVVALSFASSQLGPRLLRSFMRDRGNQVVLGTFIATFVYCLLVLRTVSGEPDEFVPHFGVTAGLLLALASLAVLIYFIHHVAVSLQADHVISVVAKELDETIETLYPGDIGRDTPGHRLSEMGEIEHTLSREKGASVALRNSGYVHAIDLEALMEISARRDVVIRVSTRPGRYVHDGISVAEVWPLAQADADVTEEVQRAFVLGRTRTSQQDVEFAVDQLVEVAVRSLSTGINDPFTAMSCIDRLGTGLLHLMRKSFPTAYRLDDQGQLRVIAERSDFGGVVDAAFHQIRQSGASTPSVMIRLLETLTLLLEHAVTDEQRTVLERHVRLVQNSALQATDEPADRRDVIDRAGAGLRPLR